MRTKDHGASPASTILVAAGLWLAIGAVAAEVGRTAEPEPASAASSAPAKRAGRVRLVLPASIPAVAGVETNVYFDNLLLVLNVDRYAIDVQCGKGMQQVERWTWTPTAADVGSHPWSIEVRDEQNELVARGETRIDVIAPDVAANRSLSILMIGDSLTHASIYPQQVLDMSRRPGGPSLTLVGTHGPGETLGEVRHEGYGGWTAQRFATHFTPTARQGDYRLRGSPFLYEQPDGAKRLDFARYVQDAAGGRAPDFVTIFLGPNDVFSQTDETLEATIDGVLGHLDSLLDAVAAGAPTTRIGLLTPVPPAATQDAFGANYASGQTRWQYKRNQHRLLERMLEKYGDRPERTEGRRRITVAPVYLNLDCQRNYPAVEGPANSQAVDSPKIWRLANGVHPSAAGYRQIGDGLYAWLLARAAERAAP